MHENAAVYIHILDKLVNNGHHSLSRGRVYNVYIGCAAVYNVGDGTVYLAVRLVYNLKTDKIGNKVRALFELEVASRGITVNCVAPGFIDTDMTKGLNEEHKKALLSQIPANRLGLPQDIANAVVFLASEGAGYMTGTVTHVNGGMFMGQ